MFGFEKTIGDVPNFVNLATENTELSEKTSSIHLQDQSSQKQPRALCELCGKLLGVQSVLCPS